MTRIVDLQMPNTYLRLMVRTTGDVARLLAGTGLTAESLAEERSITVGQQFTCIRNSVAMQRRKDWHLAWARRVSERFHGPISLAQLSAPTLGEGIDVFARYMHVRVPHMLWRARKGATEYSLAVTPRMPLAELGPILFEIPLLSLVSYVHSVRAGDLTGLTVELMHAPLVRPAEYRRWYDCEFRFEARRNAIVLPMAWRDIRNVGYDAELWRTALRQCRVAARAALAPPQGIEEMVKTALDQGFTATDLPPSPPTLDAMARRLNLSTRTLSRRLTQARTSYQALIDEVRMRLSRELLQDGMRVGEIAQTLGYANTSSFDRAFRRWFGTAPSAHTGRRR